MLAVVLSLEESPDIDGTVVEALGEFAQALSQRGTHLLLARVKDRVRDVLLPVNEPQLPPQRYAAWSVADAVRDAHGLQRARSPRGAM